MRATTGPTERPGAAALRLPPVVAAKTGIPGSRRLTTKDRPACLLTGPVRECPLPSRFSRIFGDLPHFGRYPAPASWLKSARGRSVAGSAADANPPTGGGEPASPDGNSSHAPLFADHRNDARRASIGPAGMEVMMKRWLCTS